MSAIQLPQGDPTRDLPCAHGGPAGQGVMRAVPEDFVVEERLGYSASGEGEHAFLVIRKRNTNTHDQLLGKCTEQRSSAAPVSGIGSDGLSA